MKLLLKILRSQKLKPWKEKKFYNGYQKNVGTDENKIHASKYNIWSVVNYLNYRSGGLKSRF